jgi:hypothetical protein
MKHTGVMRLRYANEVEPAPSRFADPAVHRAWCARADAWAVQQ